MTLSLLMKYCSSIKSSTYYRNMWFLSSLQIKRLFTICVRNRCLICKKVKTGWGWGHGFIFKILLYTKYTNKKLIKL